jgi:two-component system OmpR family response regulator
LARVRAVLRRSHASEEPNEPATTVLRHGKLELDRERFEVRVDGEALVLTVTEFSLLAALLERPGVVLTRGQLMQRAYSGDVSVTERTLDTHVRRIRAKFRPFALDPIATVHGVGYKAGGG